MRIAIDHRTHYAFSEPQARLVQLLRLMPQDSIDQTVVNWHIGVDRDCRLREARDGFGNKVTMLYATGPIEEVAITVQGEVLTASDAGLVRGVAEPLPPALFVRTTERTATSPEIADFAIDAVAAETALLDQAHALNVAIHRRFTLVDSTRDDGRTAAEAFAGEAASARDLAQIFVAAARGLGVPARYVSGYRPDGDHHPAPHAWAEAHVDGLGWVAFDPGFGSSADDRYVRLAVALDATGAAPVAGSRLGEGDEALDVDVQVEAIGSGA